MTRSSWDDAPLVTVNPVKLRREAATFGRFAVVGLLGAVIDFTVLNILIFGAGWSSPLQMVAANLVSTSLAIVSNFFLNRNWAFRATAARSKAQFLQFLAVSAVGLAINATVFYIVNHFILGPLLHTAFSVQLAKVAAIAVTMFWNFIANRLWTFREREGHVNTGVSDQSVAVPPAAAAAAPAAVVEAPAAVVEAPAANASKFQWRRWLLPLAAGLALLALLNFGLYRRLAGPAAAVTPVPASQIVVVQPAGAAPAAPPAQEQAAPAAAANTNITAGASRFVAQFVDGSAPSNWVVLDGDWQARDGSFVQSQTDGYDKAVLYAEPFANYVLRARFKLLQGVGAGVLFNVPGADSKNGGHLVRFNDDGTGVFWGYFSPAGAFEGQGFAATAAPGADWHDLEITSAGDTYAIRLDGNLLAQDVPLLSRSGHIGLTTSQSSAAFAGAEVSDAAAVTTTAAAEPVDQAAAQPASNGMTFNMINGDWVQDGAVIRQDNTEATDFLFGTGASAENYTLDVNITMPDDPALADAGGGIMFHMPSRDVKEGAQMVRFVNGGQGLTWGHYDAGGAFVGDGYVDAGLSPGKPERLTLIVRSDQFDVLINDKAIIQKVPTDAQQGWIGLISYRGPVTFEDIKLTLGSVAQ